MCRSRGGFPHYLSLVLFNTFSLSTTTTKKIFSQCVPPGSEHIKFKRKGKFTLEQATKTQRESRGIAVLFL